MYRKYEFEENRRAYRKIDDETEKMAMLKSYKKCLKYLVLDVNVIKQQ